MTNLQANDRVVVVEDVDEPLALCGLGTLVVTTPLGSDSPTMAVVELDSGERVWTALALVRAV